MAVTPHLVRLVAERAEEPRQRRRHLDIEVEHLARSVADGLDLDFFEHLSADARAELRALSREILQRLGRGPHA